MNTLLKINVRNVLKFDLEKLPYLWHHNQAEGQTKQDHVDPVHPPQEYEVRGN